MLRSRLSIRSTFQPSLRYSGSHSLTPETINTLKLYFTPYTEISAHYPTDFRFYFHNNKQLQLSGSPHRLQGIPLSRKDLNCFTSAQTRRSQGITLRMTSGSPLGYPPLWLRFPQLRHFKTKVVLIHKARTLSLSSPRHETV